MRYFVIAALAILLAGSLSAAAKGVIQLKDGKVNKAKDIIAETVSGIVWEPEEGAGVRIYLWDVSMVNYEVRGMDEYNGLARKLAGGQAGRMATDAAAVLKQDVPQGFDKEQWQRVRVSAMYYQAMAAWLASNWEQAISELEAYIKECEKPENIVTRGVALRVTFNSKVGGKSITDGGGLNRYYLDALENLGLAYINKGDAKNANERAFAPLQAVCEALSKGTGSKTYFDWAMRALRVSAIYAEKAKDYAGARACYVSMRTVAISQAGGEKARPVYEARIKIGFMQVLEGDTRGAQAAFTEAVSDWEKSRQRNSPPTNDWINPDLAYLTAGCYLGQGLVKASTARTAEDWAEAHEKFSTSLAIFNADDEIRSKALLGAANACAQLAVLNKDNKVEVKKGTKTEQVALASAGYALLAEKYLAELTGLLPKTAAAEDASIPGIKDSIAAHRG